MLSLFQKFVKVLLKNICYNNIDKVMKLSDHWKWHIDPSIGGALGLVLMIILMAWTMLLFPWNILMSFTFWIDLLTEIVTEPPCIDEDEEFNEDDEFEEFDEIEEDI